MIHRPTVRAGWVRYTGGQARESWQPPITIDAARQWAQDEAADREIHVTQFTHLDGSTSGMYVAPHGMARPNNHRYHHDR